MSRKTQRRHQTYQHPVHKPKSVVKPPIDYIWHNVEAFLKAGQSITPYQETMLARYAEMVKHDKIFDFGTLPERTGIIDEAAPIPRELYDDDDIRIIGAHELKSVYRIDREMIFDEADGIPANIFDWDEPPMPSREPITIEESIQHLANGLRKQSGVDYEAIKELQIGDMVTHDEGETWNKVSEESNE